jgi:cytochrome P450
MYPPAPATSRVAKVDAEIGPEKIFIPAGTTVIVNILGMHYDPELFPDPEVTHWLLLSSSLWRPIATIVVSYLSRF